MGLHCPPRAARPQWSLWRSHNGHWSTLPILAYRLLLNVFGLRTYTPFITLLIVLHLAVAHLLWRAMLRVGTSELVATGVAAVFVILGSGHANLVWAFQIGFVGSMVFGWSCVLLACDQRWSYWRAGACWLLAVASLLCSGAGTTMLALATLVAWTQRGWRRALTVLSLPAVVFLAWYIPEGRHQSPALAWSTTPRFVKDGLTNAFGTFVGTTSEVIGAIVFVAVVAGVALRARTDLRRTSLAALGLGGAVVFFVIAGLGRSNLGGTEGKSSRYVYMAIALALPAIALTLDTVLPFAVARLRRSAGIVRVAVPSAVGVIIVLLSITNFNQLRVDAPKQAFGSAHLQDQLAVASALMRSGAGYFPDAKPAPHGAPYLSAAQMEQMVRAGWFPPSRKVGPALTLRVRAGLQVAVDPPHVPIPVVPRTASVLDAGAVPLGNCSVVTPVGTAPELDLPPGAATSFTLRPAKSGSVLVAFSLPAHPQISGGRPATPLVHGHSYSIVILATDLEVHVHLPATPVTVCGLGFSPQAG